MSLMQREFTSRLRRLYKFVILNVLAPREDSPVGPFFIYELAMGMGLSSNWCFGHKLFYNSVGGSGFMTQPAQREVYWTLCDIEYSCNIKKY